MRFGDRLKKLRQQLHISMSELQKRTGISRSLFSQFENYDMVPTDKTMERMAPGLGVPVTLLRAWAIAHTFQKDEVKIALDLLEAGQQLDLLEGGHHG